MVEILAGLVAGSMFVIGPRVTRAWERADSMLWAVGGLFYMIFGGLFVGLTFANSFIKLCS